MHVSIAKARLTRGLCGLCILLTAACATDRKDEDASSAPQLASPYAVTDQPLIATGAGMLAGDILRIRFSDGTREFIADAPLPENIADARTGHVSPPVAPFETVGPETSATPTPDVQISIRPVEAWRELIRQLEQELAGLMNGRGFVLDVLQQEDLFVYLDTRGELQVVPLTGKPTEIEPATTVTLTELLQQAAEHVRKSLQTGGTAERERYLLYNTGDIPDRGYPFVLLDLDAGRVFFMQRKGEQQRLLVHGPAGSAQAAFHALNSQTRSLYTRPLSTAARLVSSLGTTVWDTLQPNPVWLGATSPPVPVSNAAFMDSLAWEQELDGLVGPGTFGRIRFLVDGAAFFPALIHDLKSAQQSIRMRMYIFDNDDYALEIADLLRERSDEVSVQILLDGFGTITGGMAGPEYTPQHAAPRPVSIGAYLRADSTISVRMLSNPWMQGDHTKTIIVDDRTAYLGGMNIGREYRYEWHDLMVGAEGPVVDELIRDFENTRAQTGLLGDLQAGLQRSRHPVRERRPGDYPLRLIHTRTGNSQILRSQIAAMRRAQNRVWIQNAYLTSDRVLYELIKARRRGVDVRVILPYQTDSGLISRSNVLAANLMLKHGIRVYVYPGMSHLKAAIYDGWACMGSANFDRLSLRLNKETNIATSHLPAVEALARQVFLPDFEHAVELTAPLPERWLDFLKEQIADHL